MAEQSDLRPKSTSIRDYVQNIRETAGLIGWLWREFMPETSRRYMKRYYAMSWVSRILSLAYPYLLGVLVDAVYDQDFQKVCVVTGIAAFIFVLTAIAEWYAGTRIELSLGENWAALERRVNELFFSKNLDLHIRESGKLTQANMEKGLNRFNALQKTFFFGFVDASNTLIISWVLLSITSPVSGLMVFTCLVINAFISLHLNKMIMTAMDPIDEAFRLYNRRRNERWDHVERVITSGKAWREVKEMDSSFWTVLSEDRAVWLRYISFVSARGLLNNFTVIAVMLYVGYSSIYGDMNKSLLIPVLTWAAMASQQVRFLARAEREINWAAPSIRSMRDALLTPATIKEPENGVKINPERPIHVSFKGLGHVYGSGSSARQVMRGISFDIPIGKKVALIGGSGAGKSTLIKLLQRYGDPASGCIQINGTCLTQTDLDSWRGALSYIAQRPQVFSGTVRDNLLYGLSEEERAAMTDEKIWAIIEELGINFGARLVDGLDTRVGRSGVKLSGGESQRLMIAAAAMKKPRFMIIDEATSSLDAESQAAVQAGIDQLLAGDASAVIIAHRLSTVMNCDMFVVLRPIDSLTPGESQIETIAHSPEELWRHSPTFRRLAELEGVRLDGIVGHSAIS